jgi:hypothetical protein
MRRELLADYFQKLLSCTGQFNSHEREQEVVELVKEFVKTKKLRGVIDLMRIPVVKSVVWGWAQVS